MPRLENYRTVIPEMLPARVVGVLSRASYGRRLSTAAVWKNALNGSMSTENSVSSSSSGGHSVYNGLMGGVQKLFNMLPAGNSTATREDVFWRSIGSTLKNSLFEESILLGSTMKKRKMAMNKHKLKKRRKSLRMNTKRSRA